MRSFFIRRFLCIVSHEMLVGGFQGLRHVRFPTADCGPLSDVVHIDDDAGDLQSAERRFCSGRILFDLPRERITV